MSERVGVLTAEILVGRLYYELSAWCRPHKVMLCSCRDNIQIPQPCYCGTLDIHVVHMSEHDVNLTVLAVFEQKQELN